MRRLGRFSKTAVVVRQKAAPQPSLLSWEDGGQGRDMSDAEIEAAILAMHSQRLDGGADADEDPHHSKPLEGDVDAISESSIIPPDEDGDLAVSNEGGAAEAQQVRLQMGIDTSLRLPPPYPHPPLRFEGMSCFFEGCLGKIVSNLIIRDSLTLDLHSIHFFAFFHFSFYPLIHFRILSASYISIILFLFNCITFYPPVGVSLIYRRSPHKSILLSHKFLVGDGRSEDFVGELYALRGGTL
jgi:hypothetical protein